MAKRATKKAFKQPSNDALQMVTTAEAARKAAPLAHKIRSGVICKTDIKGFSSPPRSPVEIVVDASKGFIPLWANDVTLRWRFQEQSMSIFQNPAAAKEAIKTLFGEALLAWGNAPPVKFVHREDAWDFEIVMLSSDDCNPDGCVLASAFFPDGSRHELILYPKMFTQDRKEQVETLAHEIGHIFGLRHFFADIHESQWPSEIFGNHKPFSIMNYGDKSTMTDDDRGDLKRLYAGVWSGQLTKINGTPIKMVQPFSAINTNPFVLSLAASTIENQICRTCGRPTNVPSMPC